MPIERHRWLSLILTTCLVAAAVQAEEVRLPNGAVYTGPLVDGLLHGQGVMVWPNGDRYEGEFRDGLMSGHGVHTGAAGWRYEGEFADGQAHGRGVADYPDGRHYEGEFEQGYESGQGSIVWPGDAAYTGRFRYGLPEGEGRIEYEDGVVYAGEFVQGREHGQGRMTLEDGSFYEGRFERGEPVEGRWENGQGQVYEGGFSDWVFSGEGTLSTAAGDRYHGVFSDGQLNGEGVHEAPDGSRYEGEFQFGAYHGQGRLTRVTGAVDEGEFEWGEFLGPNESPADSLLGTAVRLVAGLFQSDTADHLSPEQELAESALYLQEGLLNQALEQLAPETPGVIDLYAIHLAGDGTEGVFLREIEFARQVFEEQLGATDRVLTLANGRDSLQRWPMATRESLRRSLEAVAERMNGEEDILFLYLTSHGDDDLTFSIEQFGMDLPDLHARELGGFLADLDLHYKVVVVSSCYSGGFIRYLEDDATLVMTAARSDRTSFGCSDEREMTYFGRALLEDGIGSADSFVAAFEQAVERVTRQETEQEFTPSEPQIHRAPQVEAQLRAWRNQRNPTTSQSP